MHRFPIAGLLLLAALPLGCDLFSSSDFAVNLVNQDSQAIHILAPGDAFSPDNRLDPGANRFANFPNATGAEPKTFRAGANGMVFQTVTCTPSADRAPSNANVVYRASGLLVCEDW